MIYCPYARRDPMSQAPRPCSLNGFSIQGHASSLPWARGLFRTTIGRQLLYDDCMAPLLQINELRIRFASVEAVCGISLHVDEGEVLAWSGESGSARAPLHCPSWPVWSGRAGLRPNPVALDSNILHQPAKALRRLRGREIGNDLPGADDAPQSRHVSAVRSLKRHRRTFPHGQGVKQKESRPLRLRLSICPMRPERYSDYPHQFSGGQRQRILIAMALHQPSKAAHCRRANITALDVTVQAQVLELLRSLQRQ